MQNINLILLQIGDTRTTFQKNGKKAQSIFISCDTDVCVEMDMIARKMLMNITLPQYYHLTENKP